MKIQTYLLFFLLSVFQANAQDANAIIGGLKKQLSQNPDARQTAVIYSDLTWYYSTVSIDSAVHYGSKAVQEAKKLGDSTLQAQVFSDIGAVYMRKGDFSEAESNYIKAYKIRKAQGDRKGLAKINNNLATVYQSQNKNKLAMQNFLEALQYFESTKDEQSISVAKSNIGFLETRMNNYPKAIQYLKEAVKYAEKNKLEDRLCEFYINLGKAYRESNDTVNALVYYNKAQKSCKISGNVKASAIVYQTIGLIKAKQNKQDEAQSMLEKSEQHSRQFNADIDRANLQLTVARRLISQKQFAKAYQILKTVKKVFETENSEDDLLVAYKLMIPVHAHLAQADSVSFYTEKYSLLMEKQQRQIVARQTAELETKYQTSRKEKLLAENKTRLLQQQIELRKSRYIAIAISILTVFVIFIAFLIYRQQKLKNKQQTQEFELKSAIAQIENQNKLQEQRLSISRDLHDNIGAQLTFIISSVDNIKHGFDIQNLKLNSKLSYISEFTKSTIIELRDTIWAMNNNEIDFEDLRARILNFTEKARFAKEDINFNFTIDDRLNPEKLSSIAGVNIYRTIQEAVNNAIKYSDANTITIDAKSSGNQIEIVIDDDGKGFDLATVERGNGLFNMQKRIEDIGGRLMIDSEIGRGTTIQISIDKDISKT